MIRLLTNEDKDNIKLLWKSNQINLGIPFNKSIDELIENKTFYGYFLDDKMIGMCGYKIYKRSNTIRIVKLCIKEEYRQNGYGTEIVNYILSKIKKYNLPIYVECREGADNNKFYDKIGLFDRIEKRKTMNVKFYKIEV